MRGLMVAVLASVALLVGMPQAGSAQHCNAWECTDCFERGHAWKKGRETSCTACHMSLQTYCNFSSCDRCGVELVKDLGPQAEVLVDEMERASGEAFAALVEEHRDRLLFNRARGILVVTGGCDGTELAAILYLRSDQIEAVESHGVASLADRLQQESP